MNPTPLCLKIQKTWDGQSISPEEVATLTLTTQGSELRIQIDAPFHQDPCPEAAPGTTARLWEHEVVELFIVGPNHHYTEIEMGPWGHHLVLQFEGVRKQTAIHLPMRYTAQRTGPRWQGEAFLDLSLLPRTPHRVNAAAIRGVGEQRTYLSTVPLPGAAPDFHQPDAFVPCTLLSAD